MIQEWVFLGQTGSSIGHRWVIFGLAVITFGHHARKWRRKVDIQLATDRLTALAAAANRPKIAQLRDLFDKVENAIRSGVSYLEIIQALEESGLSFTYPTFAAALKRIRRERGITTRRSTARSAQALAGTVTNTPTRAIDAEHATPLEAVTPPALSVRQPVMRSSASNSVKLPDNWLTAKLTPEQSRSLTPDQLRARVIAITDATFPNPLKDAFAKDTPA